MTAKRRSQYHHGDLRTAMLREADRVLRTGGLEALSLREIARKLGVSEAAPYHHFTDRTALIAAVASDGFARLGAAFAAQTDADPRRRLVAYGAAYVRLAIAEPGAFRAMFGAHVEALQLPERPEVYAPGHNARVLLMELCGEVVKATGTRLSKGKLFALAWALVHGVAWLHLQREFPDVVPSDRAAVQAVREGVEALLSGLSARRRRAARRSAPAGPRPRPARR
jgi:AcrR family transcriptional regulator